MTHDKNSISSLYKSKRKTIFLIVLFLMFAIIFYFCIHSFTKAKNNTSSERLYTSRSYEPGKSEYLSSLTDTYSDLNNGSIRTYIDSSGYINIQKTDSSDFNIMQLTDTHIVGNDELGMIDETTLNTMYDLINSRRPDVIVLTGDIIFGDPDVSPERNEHALETLINMMDAINIPWIWTFGNHDHLAFDAYSYDELHNMLSKSNTLLMSNNNSDIFGYTNELFKLLNYDNSFNSAIITLDSGSNNKEYNYDYIHDDQVEWYESEIKQLADQFRTTTDKINTYLYFHIPPKSIDLLSQNMYSIYLGGIKGEAVCSSTHDSSLLQKAFELESTRAMCYGHDHLNDFSFEFNNIQFVYGKSIDYVAYSGDSSYQRGCTLLQIKADGSFTIKKNTYEPH